MVHEVHVHLRSIYKCTQITIKDHEYFYFFKTISLVHEILVHKTSIYKCTYITIMYHKYIKKEMQTNKPQSIVNDLGRANTFMSPPHVIELCSPIVL